MYRAEICAQELASVVSRCLPLSPVASLCLPLPPVASSPSVSRCLPLPPVASRGLPRSLVVARRFPSPLAYFRRILGLVGFAPKGLLWAFIIIIHQLCLRSLAGIIFVFIHLSRFYICIYIYIYEHMHK